MARRSRKKKQPAVSLPDDLLVEILARVPYRSLCRFKCVSQSWHALCSDPDLRKMSPQTLSGFFCHARKKRDGRDDRIRFVNLSGNGRPLVDFAAFGTILVDSCSCVTSPHLVPSLWTAAAAFSSANASRLLHIRWTQIG
ncbi:hypothetical protein ACQ4PT_018452 [Festuca glaucescens]